MSRGAGPSFPRTSYASQGAVGLDFEPTVAVNLEEETRVAIVGHSQVRRLAWVDFGPVRYRSAAGEKKFRFSFFPAPGATVQSLKTTSAWQQAVLYRAAITFLHIGSNDIVSGKVPRTYAEDITKLACELEEESGSFVKIVPLEARLEPRGLPEDEYYRIIGSVNRILRSSSATKHRFVGIPSKREDISVDGVHYTNEAALKKLQYLSVIATKHLMRDAEEVKVIRTTRPRIDHSRPNTGI